MADATNNNNRERKLKVEAKPLWTFIRTGGGGWNDTKFESEIFRQNPDLIQSRSPASRPPIEYFCELLLDNKKADYGIE